MTIFEALRVSHQTQRELAKRLLGSVRVPEERARVFQDLKDELVAHETAEERHFYVPLFEHDGTVDLSRHAIAEHHEMDEMVESLEELNPNSEEWRDGAKKLCDKIEHHLKEEEQKFFGQAGEVLTTQQKTDLAESYEAEFAQLRAHGLNA